MFRKLGLVVVMAAGLALAGCGGGSSDSGSGGAVQSRKTVSGPLTPVQNTLSSSVLQPLAVATNGTPLSGVVNCADFAVNGDALNIVNALANGLQGAAQNPQALTDVAPQIQAQVQQLAADLQQLVGALASGASCNGSTAGTTVAGDPLAGTPLAPLSAALLPVLQQITAAGQGGGAPSLSQAAAQLSQISTALNAAYAQLPASATGAPVLGGVLTTLKGTVTNLVSLLQTAAGGDPTATAAALQATVTGTLQNLLLNVLPINSLPTSSGSNVLPGQVMAGISQLTAIFNSGLTSSGNSAGLPGQLNLALLNDVLQPLTVALPAQGGSAGASVLTGLLSQITASLTGIAGGGASGNPAAVITSLLGTVLPTVTATLASILGGTTGSCLFANTPLSVLCTALGGV
ncbi:MAG TPA: hypothetical protein VN046_08550 [Stenotrophobium sp.]|jgi:hypothetical protein|nr:hypothetical protein [Stenotrophobium sp.]